jgi:hypothetical protein
MRGCLALVLETAMLARLVLRHDLVLPGPRMLVLVREHDLPLRERLEVLVRNLRLPKFRRLGRVVVRSLVVASAVLERGHVQGVLGCRRVLLRARRE